MRTEHNKVRTEHKVRTEYKRTSAKLPAGGHRCTVPTQVIRRMDIKARSTENPASVPPVAKYLDMVRLWVPGYGKALGIFGCRELQSLSWLMSLSWLVDFTHVKSMYLDTCY